MSQPDTKLKVIEAIPQYTEILSCQEFLDYCKKKKNRENIKASVPVPQGVFIEYKKPFFACITENKGTNI